MKNIKDEGLRLAKMAINNPKLLDELDDDMFFNFVIAVAAVNKSLASQLEELRPFTNAENKVLFWEAVGILMPQIDYT